MADKDLNALFLDTLKDIYYAEKQIYKSLPKMAKAANSDQLRAAFEKHHDETEGQIERLEQIFELLGKPARGKKCDAIEGILDEGTEIMEEYKGEPALDAGLLAAAQAVEHYEISRYGTLKSWAAKLSLKDAVNLLDQTLAEEKKDRRRTNQARRHGGQRRSRLTKGKSNHETVTSHHNVIRSISFNGGVRPVGGRKDRRQFGARHRSQNSGLYQGGRDE